MGRMAHFFMQKNQSGIEIESIKGSETNGLYTLTKGAFMPQFDSTLFAANWPTFRGFFQNRWELILNN